MRLNVEYEVITTEDQSPTLRFKSRSAEESMHSHRGAFNETLYIYGEALELCANSDYFSILSVGLGLGYNEILSTCLAIKYKRQDSFYLESYEKDEFLILQFKNWAAGIHSSLTPVYNQILNLFADHYEIDAQVIKQQLNDFINNKNIILKKALGFTTNFNKKFNVVLYDAFCSRTSPELWQPSFLDFILKSMANKNSCFTTYACKTTLNKVLIDNNFKIHNKKGFAGKRESTLATKGL